MRLYQSPTNGDLIKSSDNARSIMKKATSFNIIKNHAPQKYPAVKALPFYKSVQSYTRFYGFVY